MWARVGSALVGVWLIAAPGALGYAGAAAVNDRIIGPMVVAFAIISAAEVTRAVRWAELPLAGWLLLAPWLLGYGDPVVSAQSLVAGFVLLALVPVRGRASARFGGGWRSLWSGPPST